MKTRVWNRAFALLALLLLPFQAVAQDEDDDVGYLTRLLQDNLSDVSRDVRIRGFEGALSTAASIESLSIADGEGVWLEAEGLVLDWNRSALLRGRVDVETLSAERIAILRAPIPDPNLDLPPPEARVFSLPELPVSIEIGELLVEQIELGETLIGQPVEMRLEGAVSLIGGEATADIRADRTDGVEGSFVIAGDFSNDSRNLEISARVDEAPGGIVASTLDLPGDPSVSMLLEGNAPIDDFSAELSIDTDGEERIAGSFALSTEREETDGDGPLPPATRAFSVDIGGDVTTLFAPDYREFFGPDIRLAANGRLSPDGALDLPELSITAQSINIDGSLELGPGGWPERFALDGTLEGDGEQVLLPLGGPRTYVDRGEIYVAYDVETGDEWSGFALLEGFERPGLSLPSLSLFGDGVITQSEGNALGDATANLNYSASGIVIDDLGVAEALGDTISGLANIRFDEGEPVEIEQITIEGDGLSAEANATLELVGDLAVRFATVAEVADFGRFSTLAGTPLEGSGQIDVSGNYLALGGSFDIDLTAETASLAIGNEMVDPLIGGDGTVRLVAERDLAGTRVETFSVSTDAVTATGDASLTSTVATIDLNAEISDLGLVSPQLAGPGTLDIALERDAELVTVFDGDLVAGTANLAIDGTAQSEENGYLTDFTVSGMVEDLASFADIAGQDLAGSAQLEVTGQVQPVDQLFDIDLAAETENLAIGIEQVDPLIAGSGRLNVSAARDAAGITVDRLDLTTDEVTVTGTAQLGEAMRSADIDAELREVALVLDGLSGPATLSLTADQDNTGNVAVDLSATAPETSVSFDGTVAPPEQDYVTQGVLTADIATLAPFGDLVGRPLAGAVELSASGMVEPLTRFFDLDLQADTEDLAIGEERVDPLIGGTGRLRADAKMDAESLLVRSFSLTTDAIEASGEGEFGDERRSARIDAALSDAGLVLPQLSGPANVSGTAEQDAQGNVDIDLTATAPSATVSVDAVVAPPEQNYRTEGTVSADITSLAPFSEIAGRRLAGAIQLQASGMLEPINQYFDLEVAADTEDLAVGLGLVDPLIDGTGRLRANAARDAESLTVRSLELTTDQLDITAEGQLGDEVRTARIDARLNEAGILLNGISGPATLVGTADQDAAGNVTVDFTATAPETRAEIDAVIAPPEENYRATGSLSATVGSLAPFSRLVGQQLRGSVALEAEGSVAPLDAAFDLDVNARTSDLGIGIEAVDQLLRGPGNLNASVARGSDGALTVRALNVGLPNLTVSGGATSGSNGDTVQFDARLADVGIFVPDLSGPVTASGTASRNGTVWTVDTDIDGAGGVSSSISGQVSQNGNLALNANGSVNLELANNILAPRRLAGTANFNLSVNGPPSFNAISGTISSSGSTLSLPSFDNALEDIQANLSLGGGTGTLDVQAQVASGGSVSLTGPVTVTVPFNGNLDLAINEVVLRDPQLYETTINGNLSVDGPISGGATVSGVAVLGRTEIQVPSSSVGALGPLPEVRHVNTPGDVAATLNRADVSLDGTDRDDDAESDGGRDRPYPLDIRVEAPARIFVRGRGLDAELGGELRITGTSDDILPVGRFDLIRGRLDILQQRFELSEGYAQLQGDFEPYLRLVASTEARDGTVVTITLEGPASDPDVSFTSSPELPQDEVLSRLLFGRDLASISPLQAVQLAAAVGTLAGRGGGGLIGGVRNGLGLDDLDITTDDEGNAAVRAGVYLSENIYTDLTVNAEGETEIDLNLDITDNVTARGTVGGDGETSLGIFYERDY
ncbi:translocation/assembly module TamB domain-containing protein [Pelagovum pacificum]|uniref:Translocation and assembly module TamB C-terminal domain-containing protein n=1 Tax=Pelagovum pacificum TaxID=2588711 RepID=A0A5C5G8F3_9RHOB|nr:translocation/assembly module TamB domain-containing protein [Pelagovum pacificum]QQA41689.1 translocation/assembly module TamB domain-containing protein [Pelagovum pacificum]TNY30966.1 hypothetical protein FHY64_17880 [Pelagovum pacificum]